MGLGLDYFVKGGYERNAWVTVYLLERRLKTGFRETVWAYQKHMDGWKYTGICRSTCV